MAIEKISLVLPTRRRAESFQRMYQSALAQASRPHCVECCIYVDDDDDQTADAIVTMDFPSLQVRRGPRILLSAAWNAAYEIAQGPIYMHCGDDVIFRTEGWDELVRQAFESFPDRIVFVYGRDGYQDESLGTHGFLHSRWIDSLGYFVPPYFSSDYNDTWLNEIARNLNRRCFLPELFIEHMHYMVGKGPLDEVHQERIERGRRDDVAQIYASLAHLHAGDTNKLNQLLRPKKEMASGSSAAP